MTDEEGTKTGFAREMARHDLALLLAATYLYGLLAVGFATSEALFQDCCEGGDGVQGGGGGRGGDEELKHINRNKTKRRTLK